MDRSHLVLALLCIGLRSGEAGAQTPIENGAQVIANLLLNTTNDYTFSATNGEAIQVRMGAPFRPRINLYGPDGTMLMSASGSGSSSLDALLQTTLGTNGIFRVAVSSYYGNDSGSYLVNLAKAPGAFVVSDGDEGGTLVNGRRTPGVISLGDMDLWSFPAKYTDTILLRMGMPGYRPYFQVYGPGGALLATGTGGGSDDTDAYVAIRAFATGTFTVVAQSYYFNNHGPYTLLLAKPPGPYEVSSTDGGGELVNGADQRGTLTLGDMDIWTFQASAGDHVTLRMGAPGFRPLLHFYDPAGIPLRSDAGTTSADRDASLAFTATNTGTYTAVATAYYPDATGPYSLTLAKTKSTFVVSPGDEGGPLINGAATRGTNALGDVDIWTFTATAGDTIALRVGAPDFRPRLSLYGPHGAHLDTPGGVSGSRDAYLVRTATNTGTFTVILQSYYSGGAGPYTLHLARIPGEFTVSPGDEGGTLLAQHSEEGVIDLGDLDVWQFVACRGTVIQLRCEKLTGTIFGPQMRLFDRSGILLGSTASSTWGGFRVVLTNSGVFTILVNGNAQNHAGSYRLSGDGFSDGLHVCGPYITDANVVVGGVGGTPGAPFVLFTHTDVAAAAVSWEPIWTNRFDAFGAFDQTNLFRPAELQRYFRLQQP